MGDFTMPSLGADMDKGTLSEWRVAPGDEVRRGDTIAVIQTEKSDVDVEVFESGVVAELLVEPGTEVAVGTPLARIEPSGAAPTDQPTPAGTAAEPPAPPEPRTEPTPAPPRPSGGTGHRHASLVLSPVVRHLAESLRVDTTTLAGSGPGGRITRADVEAAASGRSRRPAASPLARRTAAARGIDLASLSGTGPDGAVLARDVPDAVAAPAPTKAERMRSAISRLMTKANQEIPHYHVTSTVDVDAAMAWLDERNAEVGPAERILPAALWLRAVGVALGAAPELNGWWEDDAFRPSDHVDLGVAISLRGGGVVTSTIAGVDECGLPEVMDALKGLVQRSRRGNLRGSDLAPASLTVTNLGEQGAEEVLGVIHPPQVALVGLGRPIARPVVVEGAVVVHRTVRATLSGDHRATDGHAGSRFLAALQRALDHPQQL